MLTRYSTPGDTPSEYTLAAPRSRVSNTGTPTVSCLSVSRGRVTSVVLHDSVTATRSTVAAMAHGCRGRPVMPSSFGKSCDNLTRWTSSLRWQRSGELGGHPDPFAQGGIGHQSLRFHEDPP